MAQGPGMNKKEKVGGALLSDCGLTAALLLPHFPQHEGLSPQTASQTNPFFCKVLLSNILSGQQEE